MNALLLLMVLLGVSYFAGLVGEGRAVRGLGLPSGVEWVTVGLVLGPMLGVVGERLAAEATPVAMAAVGWYALVLGLDFGVIRRRRVPPLRIVAGVAIGLVIALAVAAVAYWVLPRFIVLEDADRLTAALGLGSVWTSTTPHAVRWGRDRLNARGPVSDLLADLADVRDAVAIAMAGLAFSLRSEAGEGAGWVATAGAWVVVAAVVAGLVMGGLAAILLRGEFQQRDAWAVLLGASALASGASLRLGQSVLLVPFLLGLGLAGASRHRDALSSMVDPTERPVLLPALLLTGVFLDPAQLGVGWAVVLVTAVARAAAGLLVGSAVLSGRGAGAALAMASSGSVALCTGLLFAVRFPGVVGAVVLQAAIAAAIAGEVIGAWGLRRVLTAAGEAQEPVRTSSAVNGASR